MEGIATALAVDSPTAPAAGAPLFILPALRNNASLDLGPRRRGREEAEVRGRVTF